MELQPVPVMGLDGWVFTPKEKMDNLFMNFVSANKSQSVTAPHLTFSYQYILAMWQMSREKLQDDLRKALMQYFGPPYFASVTVDVKVKEDTTKGGAYNLEIYLEAKDEYGKSFNLSKILQDFTSKSSRWVNLNNYGNPDQFSE